MSVETIFDQYYERASLPIRNTESSRTQLGSLDIRQVIEDDEFRNLNHKIVLKDGVAASVWREQEWGFGENSLDVTHFKDGIVQSLSIRYTGAGVTGLKLSLTRNEWLISDPDYRLPFVFGRSDMESWFRTSDLEMGLTRLRLAFDRETKHTYSVKDIGVDKKRAQHLYRDVEYRIDLGDRIQLTIDGKSPRKIDWRTKFNGDEIVRMYEYVSTEEWIDGWGPIADIIEARS
ncbi:MAG TPA: hypothetical protein EYQ61_03395 [Dehalococcoidia bacterium]|jgi:hypothetical protein|nr:hypothetical protein [Dehalococcoidia bacterium]HIK90300.1 hypothetical protein [Dehalococcoidia bacterium]